MVMSHSSSLKKPAPLSRITLTLVIAVVMTLLPWSGHLLQIQPAWVLMVLLYWGIHEPKVINGAAFFVFGLIADVAQSSTLGIHALSFSIVYWLLANYRQRILTFYAANQALHLLPAFIINQIIIAISIYVLNKTLPHAEWLLQSPLSTVCWLGMPYFIELTLIRRGS